MPSRELAGMDAEEDFRGTWAKHGAHGAEPFGDVSYVKARSRPTEDHRADGTANAIVLVVEQAQRVVRQAEHEVHSTRRNNVLAALWVGMGIDRFVQGPDGLDKRTQCRSR
jgi:hypothetical protein